MSAFEFPGEKYLLEDLPDYGSERQMLVVKFFLTFVFWTILVPSFLASETHDKPGDGTHSGTSSSPRDEPSSKSTTTKSSSRTTRKTTTTTVKVQQRKTQKKSISTKKQQKIGQKEDSQPNQQAKKTDTDNSNTVKVVNGYANLLCLVAFILHAIYLLVTVSPDNYYTSRTVFETPLFTQSECDYLVEMAERVAGKNYDMAQKFVETNRDEVEDGKNSSIHTKMMGYLKEPFGWQKTRHKFHPTTDLNLVTDSFSDEDRAWIQQRLDARLAPTLERIFGVPPSAIRANDMFLVRYDGDRQASLSRHTDNGSITFSTLLSYGFEGGGTRYWNRAALNENNNPGAPFTYVLPKAGMMTTFPAMIEHEGVQTTKGRRYLLIGFLAVDNIDPWTHRPTGLPWFASWGSLNWASTKLKEGMQAARKDTDVDREQSDINPLLYSDQAVEIFQFVYKFLVGVCDVIFPHRFAVLVDETSADDFLGDLDEAYKLKQQSSAFSQSSNYKRSSWFAGQQISVNIDGSFRKNWKTRQDADDKFGVL